MRVDHELRQRTVHPRHSAFQDDKAAARHFRGQIEIHVGGNARNLEMLFGFEIERARGAPAVYFDIVVFIRPVRHIFIGQVGDFGQQGGQARIFGLCLFGQVCNLGLFLADQCAQAFKFCLVALGLGRAHQFGGCILFGLCGFRLGDAGPAGGINRKDFICHRCIATAGQCGVKGGRGVTDRTDIMHGGRPLEVIHFARCYGASCCQS